MPYQAQLRALGVAPGTVQWRLSRRPPAGLSLRPRMDGTATLMGVPQQAGRFELPLLLTAEGLRLDTALQLEIEAQDRLQIETGVLPTARVGQTYSATITASGGTQEGLVWSLEELPPGLRPGPQQGPTLRILGVPEQEGAFRLNLEVQDSAGSRATSTLNLNVLPGAGALAIRLPEPPGGLVGQPLSLTIEAVGGRAPMRWSTSGPQVPGLAFQANAGRLATLTGTPQQRGRFELIVLVMDADETFVQETLEVIIAAPLAITTEALPVGTMGEVYEASVQASEGGGEHRWTLLQGNLPMGLSFVEAGQAARLQGVPSSTGSFALTVQASDRLEQTAQRALELVIVGPLALGPSAAPAMVRLGDPLDAPLRATGGRAPYTFSLVSGALPPGLELEGGPGPLARLVGVAGQVGRFSFDVEVLDRDGRVASVHWALEVDPSGVPLEILPVSPAPLRTCEAGRVNLRAEGGARFGHTWTTQGSLPDGIWLPSVSTPTVALGGVPSALGVYPVTIEVTDSNGERATRSLTLEIIPGAAPRWAITNNASAPDGRDALALVDLCRTQPRVHSLWPSTSRPRFELSPNGRWLSVLHTPTSSASEHRLVDLSMTPPSEQLLSSGALLAHINEPRFSEDSARMFFTEERLLGSTIQTAILRHDLGSAALPQTLHLGPDRDDLRLRSVSPSGAWVIFEQQSGPLSILPAGGGAPTVLSLDAYVLGFDASEQWLFLRDETDRNNRQAVAWELAAGGPASPLIHTSESNLELLPGRTQAILVQLGVSAPRPWLRYTLSPLGPIALGPLPGTEVCNNPTALPGDRWVWCSADQAINLLDMTGPLGLIQTLPPEASAWSSPGGARIIYSVELGPSSFEVSTLELSSLPTISPLSLGAFATRLARVDFAPTEDRVMLLTAQPGALATVHELSGPLMGVERWRGQVSVGYNGSGWRPDGSGLFVFEGGELRWLDLSLPEHPRLLTIEVPTGVHVDRSPSKVRVQP